MEQLELLKKLYEIELLMWGEKSASLKEITRRYNKYPDGFRLLESRGEIIGFAFCFPSVFTVDTSKSWYDRINMFYKDNNFMNCNCIFSASFTVLKGNECELVYKLVSEIEKHAIQKKLKYVCIGIRLLYYNSRKRDYPDINKYVQLCSHGKNWEPLIDIARNNGWIIGHAIKNYYIDKASCNYGVWVYKTVL